MNPAVALAFVSCPPDHAAALARSLVEARVSACVNIIPAMQSVYRWQGEVCSESESLLLIKHPAEGFDALKAEVLKNHPYELPEVIAVKLTHGHAPYLQWILDSCA